MGPILKACVQNQGSRKWGLSNAIALCFTLLDSCKFSYDDDAGIIWQVTDESELEGELHTWKRRVSKDVSKNLKKYLRASFEEDNSSKNYLFRGHSRIALMLDPQFKCLKGLLSPMTIANVKSLIATYDIIIVAYSVAIFDEETKSKRGELEVSNAVGSEGTDSTSPFPTPVE